jgi:HK97 family phage portal protein
LDPLSHATVATCVRIISTSLSSLPWKVYRGKDEDKVEVTDRTDPWYRLFSKPNALMTRAELKELTAAQMLLSGESFWVLLNAAGEPVEEDEIPTIIWPKSGSEMSEVAPNGILTGWSVGNVLGKAQLNLPLHSVLQIADSRDPLKVHRGISRIRAASLAMRNDDKSQRWNEAFFDRDASPGGVLTSGKDGRNLTPAEAREVQKLWQDAHQGIGKSQGVAVLPNGLQWSEQTRKHTDMQFHEGMRWNREQIAAVMGVPLVFFAPNETSYKNTSDQYRALLFKTVLPLARKIEDAVEQALIEPRSTPREIASNSAVWLEFDASQALQEDETTRLANWQKAMDGGVPFNEATKTYSLPFEAQEWGDEGSFATMRTPAEEVFAEPEPVPATLAPFAGQPAADTPPVSKDPHEEKPKPEAAEEQDEPEAEKPRAVTRDDEAKQRRAEKWAEFERSLRPSEAAFRKVFSSHVRLARQETLEMVRVVAGRSVRATPGEFEAALAELRRVWDERIQEAAKPVYQGSAVSALSHLAKELEGGLKHINAADPKVAAYMAQRTNRITGINATMAEAIRETLFESVAANETVQQMQERVRTSFGMSRSSALRIARTESASAVNGVRQIGMAAEGVTHTEWLSSRDKFVRETHDIDGETQPLGQQFSNGCKFPGDPDAPASEVCNCRCTSAPVVG